MGLLQYAENKRDPIASTTTLYRLRMGAFIECEWSRDIRKDLPPLSRAAMERFLQDAASTAVYITGSYRDEEETGAKEGMKDGDFVASRECGIDG